MNITSVIVLFLSLNLSKSRNVQRILMTDIEKELFEISSYVDELVFAHVVSKRDAF